MKTIRGTTPAARGTGEPAFGAMNSPLLPLPQELDRITGLGFDFFELAMDAPMADHATVRSHAGRIREGLDGAGMGLVCHLPTFVYTADPCEAIRHTSLEEMRHSLETAADLGARKAVIHPSPFSGLGRAMMETTLARCRENLDTICRRAAVLGIVLCLENMFPRYHTGYRPAEFEGLLEDHPDLMLTLDVGHANLGDKACGAAAFIDRFPSRIGHLHFSDNSGTRDDHLPVGRGTIAFDDIVERLVHTGYGGTLTLEIFSGVASDLAESRQRVLDLWRAVSP